KSRILGIESHLVIMRHGGQMTDYRQTLSKVSSYEGVIAVTPFIYTQTMLRSASGISGAVLRGIEPDTAKDVINVFNDVVPPQKHVKTDAEPENEVPEIVLGKELARRLGVRVSDTVYLISPAGILSPIGHVPAMKRFQVSDIFESGMYEYDGSLAFIHLGDAQKILRMEDSVTGIEVRVKDIYKAGDIAEKIVSELGFPYWARDWTQMNQNLFAALKLEKTVMFIILALIILVAAFNIASTLIMMVMEKTRDIAILKAMGATDKSIGKIFVIKGMVIGVIGTFIGVTLGFVLCKLLEKYKFIELPGDVYYISTLPVRLELLDIVMIATAAIVICFLATLYPARQASKLNPVEAIRYG
ncbi:MAG: FtsX-like permease family protein, partial [Desulfobacteraceae bacterium]|nr:FtsX-like permease family protein [Desulfobacteraceae bacterium]